MGRRPTINTEEMAPGLETFCQERRYTSATTRSVLFEAAQCEKFLQTYGTNLLQATAADIVRYEEYRAAAEGCRTRDTIRWRLRVGFTFLEAHGLRSGHPVPLWNGGRATSLGDMGPAFESYAAKRQGCTAWRAHLMTVEAARLGSFLQRDGRRLDRATAEDVARYLDERCAGRREWARATVTGKLRPWFEYLRVHGLRADNPCGAPYRPRRRPLGDLAMKVEAYLVEALGLSAGTARHVALEAERLGTFLRSRGRDVVQATLTDIEQYEGERFRALKVGTRSAVVGNLRALFRYLQTTGQRKDNPGEWLDHPRVDRLAQVPPVLEPLRVERFLTKLARRHDGFARRDLALATLLYGAGLRSCEAVGLTVSDADPVSATLLVRHGKGHRQRIVPLLAEVSAALAAYQAERGTTPPDAPLFLNKRGRAMTTADVRNILHNWGERLGFEVRAHQMRHSCASHLLQRGVSIEAIRGLLGHAGLRTTMLYARLRSADLVIAMRRHPVNHWTGGSGMAERQRPVHPAAGTRRRVMRPKLPPSSGRWGEQVAAFLASPFTTARYSERTRQNGFAVQLRDLGHFLAERGVESAEAVRSRDLVAWLQHGRNRGLTQVTLGHQLAAARAFFRYVRMVGWIHEDPAMPIRLAKGHSPETRTLTEEEVLRLLSVPDRETAWGSTNLVLLLLLYATGIRACEASAADVGDLDLREGWLTVHGKGARLRRVPVPKAVLPELRRHVAGRDPNEPFLLDTRGRRMSPHQISDNIAHRMAEAGLGPGATAHVLRHTCAEHLLAHGARLEAVSTLLGHRTLRETSVYAHVGMEELRSVVLRLPLKRGEGRGRGSDAGGDDR